MKLYGPVNFWYINCKIHDKICCFFSNNLKSLETFYSSRASGLPFHLTVTLIL